MRPLLPLLILLLLGSALKAQVQEKVPPIDKSKWGPNDTIRVPAIYYDHEWMPYSDMEMVFVANGDMAKLAQSIKDYNRLRNAVYFCYPLAEKASAIINEVNAKVTGMSRSARKKYIKSREKDLRREFEDPMKNMSVYQGRVLMKLIYRETGTDCYDIIRDYKGGVNARMFQTAYFFYGGDFKQEYDLQKNKVDRQIEVIVREYKGVWYNPYRPGAQYVSQ